MTETDLPDDPATAVAVAYVHSDVVHYSWHHSMTELLALDANLHARIWRGGYVAMRGGTDGLADARNTAIHDFLKDSTAEWLWWIDTDMGFAADTIERLFDAADPAERPVVGALCFANREVSNDGMGGRRAIVAPMVLEWKTIDGESGFDVRWDYPQNTLTRVDGVGSACVLIHRSVFERVQHKFGPNWYSRARNPSTNKMISEDLSFCVRLNALEIPMHVHTGVATTHAKMAWLGEEDYWRQRALNPAPPTADAQPREVKRDWDVPRYAIIPTHNRPQLLLALVASLGRQADAVVVVDNASAPPVDADALCKTAPGVVVEVIRDDEQPPNLARLWNVMLDRCAELAKHAGQDAWDVAALNDDAVLPATWYGTVATALREHPTAALAHTTPTTPALLTELRNDPGNRMCPHAFVTRGELGLRADETMRWWYFDTDFDLSARQVGGVLSVPGPRVINARANSTTVGVLAEQAHKDRDTFEAKWGGA